jgi:hypothetical protein
MQTFTSALKPAIKKVLPAPLLRAIMMCIGEGNSLKPGTVRFGDLRRTSPINSQFGFDRGTPIDRYYIGRFPAKKAACIRGRVLEIGGNDYTTRFGSERVKQSDILHVDASNARATIVGDLGCSDVAACAAKGV